MKPPRFKSKTQECITVGEIKKLREAGFPLSRIAYFLRLDLSKVKEYAKMMDDNKK